MSEPGGRLAERITVRVSADLMRRAREANLDVPGVVRAALEDAVDTRDRHREVAAVMDQWAEGLRDL